MPFPLSVQLTEQFYAWEQRGRGWNVYDAPVRLEPPYQPFRFRYRQTAFVDDGRAPNLFQEISALWNKWFGSKDDKDELREQSFMPRAFTGDRPLRAVGISFPKGQDIEVEETEQLLLMLSYCQYPASFEIVATEREIAVQFVCREPDLAHVRSQLKAYFPNVTLQDRTEHLDELLDNEYACTLDFGLEEEFMRPLNMPKKFDLDPLIGLLGGLEYMERGERGVVQILFTGTDKPWAESVIRSVTVANGDAFFGDSPEMVSLAEQKIAGPFFAVTIRAIAGANTERRSESILSHLSNGLIQMSRSQGNALLPLNTYEGADSDLLLRQSHRLGMLLNSRELATFVHFPSASVVSSKLSQDVGKTKQAPAAASGNPFVLGVNEHQGKQSLVTVSAEQRLRHMHIIGATGTGKSTLLLNLISQDIANGEGLALLDPHGDLIDQVLVRVPAQRLQDVILLDPSDTEFPVGFNILTTHSEIEKDILSSDLVSAFRRLSTSWGDQMTSVLANTILAFLESTKGGTLIDLRRFLIEKNYRDAFLKTVSDTHILYYWQREYPLLKSSSIGPILTRLDSFLRPKIVRNMVAQKKSLDFEQILNGKKILLVKLSQGLIGNENSYLLGTFIVSKIHQAAMARQAQAIADRTNFYLYIDEFQHFITPSMASILSGARKYHLGLVLAHQDMQQLVKEDGELAGSVMANAGTRICFRVGDSDAKRFEDGFSFFDAADLQNLKTGEAIVRIDRPDQDCNVRVIRQKQGNPEYVERIVSLSRRKYGTPKSEVEAGFEIPKEEPEEEKAQQEERKEEERNAQGEKTERREPPRQEKPYEPETTASATTEAAEPEPTAEKKDSQHRYLQMLVKRMAEARGFKAVIEEATPDGKGRVDVALLRDKLKIACEITVTTTDEWEVHNIEKCLAAGFEIVVVCSTNPRSLSKIKTLIEAKLPARLRDRVRLFQPEELFLYLDQLVAKEAGSETRVKGYRVKVSYTAVSGEEARQKKESITKSVADSLRKSKK